jgi:hypothetical protein
MATTTNYGWTTPDDTALVKDGAAAIRTLGSSVDTTTKALNPSTTLGDVEYRSSTANTNTRLGIGTTGQVLTVSGGVPAWTTISTSPANADATVATSETTSSTTYTDLTTAGPAVTVTTGTRALVIITCNIRDRENRGSYMSYAVTGATTTAAADTRALSMVIPSQPADIYQMSFVNVATTTAGSNTFTAKYRTDSAAHSAAFANRSIFVMNLG